MSAGPRLASRSFDWTRARELRRNGLTYNAIADKLGVSRQAVRLACDDVARIRERGAPLTPEVELRSDLQRIAEHFEFAQDGCWHWTGALFENGYGAFWRNGQNVRAHRAMYELLVGPIPEGLDLDHLCRVRRCINPTHLEPVTRAENNRRARSASPSRRAELSDA